MFRRSAVALVATAAVSLAACSSGDPAGSAGVTPETAKTSIERAAACGSPPCRSPPRRASRACPPRTPTPAAAKDKQVVGLFVMKNADVADEVSDLVRSSAPKSAQLMRSGTVMVVYAPVGSDRSDAVERAVEEL